MTRSTRRLALALAGLVLALAAPVGAEEYLGRLGGNRFTAESTRNPYGLHGSRFSVQSPSNPYTVTPPILLGD